MANLSIFLHSNIVLGELTIYLYTYNILIYFTKAHANMQKVSFRFLEDVSLDGTNNAMILHLTV